MEKAYEAVVMGVSSGGMKALTTIIPGLPKDFSLSIVIIQHREESKDEFYVNYLNDMSGIIVKEAQLGEEIKPGVAYLAPGGYHLLIEDDKTFALSLDPPVNYARPSIDVCFESAADVYGENLIGVILTGANSDGASGLKKIKKGGGLAIVQDPGTAEFVQMPRSAIEAAQVDAVLVLDEIASFLKKISQG